MRWGNPCPCPTHQIQYPIVYVQTCLLPTATSRINRHTTRMISKTFYSLTARHTHPRHCSITTGISEPSTSNTYMTLIPVRGKGGRMVPIFRMLCLCRVDILCFAAHSVGRLIARPSGRRQHAKTEWQILLIGSLSTSVEAITWKSCVSSMGITRGRLEWLSMARGRAATRSYGYHIHRVKLSYQQIQEQGEVEAPTSYETLSPIQGSI